MDLILNSSILDLDFVDKFNTLIKENISVLNLMKKHSILIQYSLRNTVLADKYHVNLKNDLLEKHTFKIKEIAQMNKLKIQSVFFEEKDELSNIRIILEQEYIEIKDVEQYHIGINKKYEKLYVEFTLDNANLLTDNVSAYLKSFLTEKNIPFGAEKTYEIFIFYNYFEQDKVNNYEENIQVKIKKVRESIHDLIPFVDIIFVFGEETKKQYEVKIQICETLERRPCNNYILTDDRIREKLIVYYQGILVNNYLETSSKPVKKTKKNEKFIFKYGKPVEISENEVKKYKWAVCLIEDIKNPQIFDRKYNAIITLCVCNYNDFSWSIGRFSKVCDSELKEKQKKIIERLSKSTFDLFKELLEVLGDLKYMALLVDLPEDSDLEIIWNKFKREYFLPTDENKEYLRNRFVLAYERKEKDDAESTAKNNRIKEELEQMKKMADDVANNKIIRAEFDENKKIIKEEDVKLYYINCKKITFENGAVIYRCLDEGWEDMSLKINENT